jgi:hypothetical protein
VGNIIGEPGYYGNIMGESDYVDNTMSETETGARAIFLQQEL